MAAAALEQRDSRTTTGLTNSTHSSNTSVERYRLDEDDTTTSLLYEYRGGHGLKTTSQKELCARLEKDDSFRVTSMPIPRYTSYMDVRRHDLFLPDEQEMYRDKPNYDASLASIRIPAVAYISRILLGNYDNLYIISPETSPSTSVADSESRRSTWGKDSEEDVKPGADQE